MNQILVAKNKNKNNFRDDKQLNPCTWANQVRELIQKIYKCLKNQIQHKMKKVLSGTLISLKVEVLHVIQMNNKKL